MKFKKILALGYDKETLKEDKWEKINAICEDLVLLPKDSSEILSHLKDADCLLLRLAMVADKELIDNAPNLKYIGMFGTGYGKIDTEYAASKGITVCNIAGYSTDGVAELTFALILEHLRDVSRAKQQASNGDYSEASFKGTEIAGKKFGLIGLGKIGARTAEIAANGFNADVLYYSRNRKTDKETNKIKYQENLKKLMEECDFISLNMACSEEIEGYISEELINAIKPGAIFINVSPMELIDMSGLKNRLEKNDITFICDHSDELSEQDAKDLSKYPNCILYPPIGYITEESKIRMQEIFVSNLENYLNNTPTNKVN